MRCEAETLADPSSALSFDPTSGVVAGEGWQVRLVRRQAQLFGRILSAGGRVVSVSQLIQTVYSIDDEPEAAENSVYAHLSKVRARLEPYGVSIVSERHKGYRICISQTFGKVDVLPPAEDLEPAEYRSLSVTLYDREVLTALQVLAERHACMPHHAAMALLKAMVSADLVEAVLDGDPPQSFVHIPGALRKSADNVAKDRIPVLGSMQRRFLDWFAAQPPGTIELPMTAIGERLGCARGQTYQILKSLELRGYIEVTQPGKRGGPATFYRMVRRDAA